MLHQFIGGDHAAAALSKLCRHVGLHRRRHELDDLHSGFFQLEPQRLGVGVDRSLRSGVDWRRWQRHKGEPGGHVDHCALIAREDVNERGGRSNDTAHVDVHLRH